MEESLQRALRHKTEELDIYLSKKRLFGSNGDENSSLSGGNMAQKDEHFRLKMDENEILEDCNRRADESLKISQESLLSLKLQREKLRVTTPIPQS